MSSVPPQSSPVAPPSMSPYKEMRVNELEELRQRGLAKSWSKHFSQAISKVEADLALASVALQELEDRKAKAKEFAPSANEMTQLDRMYLKVSEWKKQCSQKQKETVMLYGRYVAKYGSQMEITNPENLLVTPKKGKAMSSMLPVVSTPLATADVDELAKAFDMTDIPSFLRPSTPAAFDNRKLEEILEEASLPDPDAPCKTFGISPKTAVTHEGSDDDDDSSIVSGLTTLNSAVTKEVLHDVENKVLDFIKNETEHIRKLIEEEDDATSKACESQASRPHSISNQSLNKAENMVLEMKKILDDFKNQEKEEKTTVIRRIEGGSEGEEWYEHFDDTFQRHFYVEANSNTTQWNMPPTITEASSHSSSSVCDSATVGTDSGPSPSSSAPTPKVLDYEEFKPEARVGRRSTRIEKYRKNLRRQRRRRIAASTVLLAALGAAFMYYKHTNPVQVENMMETATAALNTTFGEYSLVQQLTSVGAPSQQVVDTKKKTKPVDVAKDTDETVSKTSSIDFISMMEASAKQVAVIVVENEVVLRKVSKKSNWIGSFVKALLGPPVYKEVNKKCSQKGQYCGDYWN